MGAVERKVWAIVTEALWQYQKQHNVCMVHMAMFRTQFVCIALKANTELSLLRLLSQLQKLCALLALSIDSFQHLLKS